MNSSNEFYLLLGDVLSSRKIKNREKFQSKIIESSSKLNNIYEKDFYAKLSIIKGSDEIGAVLVNLRPVYPIINFLSQYLYPNYLRFVVVKGAIDTSVSTKDVSKMDGPVFHQAADYMLSLKQEKLIFKMDTQNFITDTLISNNINLLYLLKKKWSPSKNRIIAQYKKTRKQKLTAEKLGLKQQTVSYHLQSAQYKEIEKIEQNLMEVFNRI
ncbi:MAG: SatD family protein [Euryarchaeota archaeon]